ncbi:phenylacetic acid degradation operon negative regulatory protein PaaX [Neptuniibacter caesariensis]|uniref:Phenylacetic acid degradation transcriptional repressor n=1 Tax=Neptuniibacter caesariensis TaxID=207954 RepID=A0A7U8GRB6_NEPCE|nr:phenylacetic acid degradation operon negative regulatory protein PaaX [Neptuniibacter caesariensis]EAR59995.1 phenylacetic acid degradation transcriptional repressor [Oceanospirillum sp. MED92] [Neptuniibacter caesariensis]
MPAFPALETLVDNFRNRRPIRAGSLIITVYGDAIAPRGGTVWLGSMIKLLEPLGLNQRLVRTSVFRLAKENWLVAEQVGRRSYYSLTGPGIRRFQKAFKRVYADQNPEWDGRWLMAILSQLEQDERQKLRQELEWHGFGTLSPTVLLHPQMQKSELQAVLQEYDYTDDVIIFEDMGEGSTATRPLRLQTRESWNLPKLAESYQSFLDKFRPIWNHINDKGIPTPEQCFQIRTLLIHEYRRIILRDPELPDELLPGDWAGSAARQLCTNIYQRVWQGAEQHMDAVLETAEGPLPPPNNKFYKRYGGLN